MSEEPWATTADSLGEAAVDLLWRQWRAIGGAAGARGKAARSQVDPEALILGSLALQHREARLWTVMSDWLVEGSRLVSTQRLKNLAPGFGDEMEGRLSHLAEWVVTVAKDARWRTLAGTNTPKDLKHPPTRRRSGGVQLQEGPSLMLRLRAGFGIGVKADIVAFLLGQELRSTVSAIGESLACSAPTAFRALQDLVAAGFVQSDEVTAATEYKINDSSWAGLLGRGKTQVWWKWWAELLKYTLDVLKVSESLKAGSASDYVVGVRFRESGERHSKALSRVRIVGLKLSMPESASPADWIAFNKRIAAYMVEAV